MSDLNLTLLSQEENNPAAGGFEYMKKYLELEVVFVYNALPYPTLYLT
jgi:hypothetical protein